MDKNVAELKICSTELAEVTKKQERLNYLHFKNYAIRYANVEQFMCLWGEHVGKRAHHNWMMMMVANMYAIITGVCRQQIQR